VIEPGKTGAYLALFSEIGLILFVLTLGGALGGHWLDEQLGITFPAFLLTGLLLGMAAGAVAIRRLISRFLATFKD
jgi:F0F1-type ATP synthase assembly protein I